MLGSFNRCKYMNECQEMFEMLGSFDRCKYMNVKMNVKMNIWGILMLGLNVGMGEC